MMITSENNQIKNQIYEKVLDSIDLGIHILDSTGKTLYYNEAAEKIDGISSARIMDQSMDKLISKGVFSHSIGMKALKLNRTIQETQKVNNKVVLARGMPIYTENTLSHVVIYIWNIQFLKNLKDELQVLKEENHQYLDYLNRLKSKFLPKDKIISKSKKMNQIVELVDHISNVDSTILLTGESGVGKTMLAKHIHNQSYRHEGPFVKLDCSAISESLIESELFGYEEGSFTGAKKGGKAGVLIKANKGTLFLDEIGDMPVKSQVKLLTVLQDKEIQPVGSTKKIKLNVRIISATNQNLEKKIKEGTFREDLYYRLKVVPITIPPLRERRADIALLMNKYLKEFNDYYDKNVIISSDGKNELINYSWPGNVRELENVIERLVVTSENNYIDYKDVKSSLPSKLHNRFSNEKDFKEKVIDYEKSLLLYYSERANSIKDLARLVKINESTLRKKIERYNIKLNL